MDTVNFTPLLPLIDSGELDELLKTMPAGQPPPGVTSNFHNPANRGPYMMIVGGILEGLMLMFLCVRLYAKCCILRRFSLDDVTCTLAALLAIAYYVDCCLTVTGEGRFGRHIWDVTAADIIKPGSLIPAFVINWLLNIPFALAKVTFLILYLQIFKPIKMFRMIIYAGMFVIVGFYLSVTIYQLYIGIPRRGETWLDVYLSPRYTSALSLSTPIAAVGLGFDLYLLILPIVGVNQLQLSRQRKIGVIVVFATGFCACIASSLSIYFRILLGAGADVMWNIFPVVLAALTEMCVGVICSCMPSLAAFVRTPPPFIRAMKEGFAKRLSSLSDSSLLRSLRRPYFSLYGNTARSSTKSGSAGGSTATALSESTTVYGGKECSAFPAPRAPNVTMNDITRVDTFEVTYQEEASFHKVSEDRDLEKGFVIERGIVEKDGYYSEMMAALAEIVRKYARFSRSDL